MLNWRDPWHPEGGGSELYVAEVAARLEARGARITMFCARYPGSARSEERDRIRYVRRGGHLTVYLWAALYVLTRRFGRVDRVLEVQNGMPFLARLFTSAPVVVLVHHVHREQWPILGPVLARVGWLLESRVAIRVNRRSRYLTVSEVTRTELVGLGVAAPQITIAWNGTPELPDLVEQPPSEHPSLAMLVRLVPHKRVEHALEAVARLREQFPGLTLTVMGDGWWGPELHARRHDLGLDDCVHFAGFVTDHEKYRVLSASWVHLLPSVKEGWGLSIVEAARVGVPSVAYRDAGGVAESILDGVTGLLAGDLDDLVEQSRRLLGDHELRRDLGEKARVRAQQFTWSATAASAADVLDVDGH